MLWKGKRRPGLIAALAAVTLSASLAHAADPAWTPVGDNPAGDRFEFDAGSLWMRGGAVAVTTRARLKAPARDNLSGKAYVAVVARQLQNCASHVSATIAFSLYDSHGAVVSSYDVPEADWAYVTPAPSAIAAGFQARVCQAAEAAGLKVGAPPPAFAAAGTGAVIDFASTPGLKVGPSTKGWRRLGASQGGVTLYVLPASIGQLDTTRVALITKTTSKSPVWRSDGYRYRSLYQTHVVNCERRTDGVAISDFYDAGRKLLISSRAPTLADVAMTAPDGPQSARLLDAACKADETRPAIAELPTGVAAEAAADATDDTVVVSGTAWIGPKGYLITANHVVDGAEKLSLMQDGKTVGTAELVVADPANDIAILKAQIGAGSHVAIALHPQPALLGEPVFTLGFPAPDALGLSLKMTSGEVSALAGNDAASQRTDDARFLQISAPIQSGSSGGPVMTDDGRAVGIVISRMQAAGDNETAQNVNYALKIAYVRALLEPLP
ncbi:MAG: trypsin-like peptidase domain-containing protein, partial [Proteobacteria bacterium]|nr:trypsin-like peptidase domain-containing protein [Pseudomonadota bacterium]